MAELTRSLDVAEVGEAVRRLLGEMLPADDISLVLRPEGERGSLIHLVPTAGLDPDPLADTALLRRAVEGGQPVVIDGLAADSRWQGGRPRLPALLLLPPMVAGQCVGATVLGRGAAPDFTPGELGKGQLLADVAAPELRNAMAAESGCARPRTAAPPVDARPLDGVEGAGLCRVAVAAIGAREEPARRRPPAAGPADRRLQR